MTTQPTPITIDPALDLVLERTVPVAPELVWQAWTEPEHVVKWFAPEPFRTTLCEIDLYPGGKFRTVMSSPDGDVLNDGTGAFLEVIPNRRLAWTTTLGPGFRPNGTHDMPFTAFIDIEPDGNGGTRYTAIARHAVQADHDQHEEMGFHEGWGTCLDQLVAYMQSA
jgi:uncharacterized protein YndB with AHSA1/START domain